MDSREYHLQDLDAEIYLLGSVLQYPKSMGEISLILKNGGEFYIEKHRHIWNAMINLYRDSAPIDPITVANALEKANKLEQVGGRDYIFYLNESVSNAAHVDSYAEIIKDKFILRSLIESSNETIRDAYKPEAVTKDILDSTQKRIIDLAKDQLKENTQEAGVVAREVLNKLLTQKSGELAGCPTGFTDIDNLTNGLQKTDLIILAARPAMGKTAFALNIATNAAMQGKTVLFFSLEMSADQLVKRVLSSMAEIDQKTLRDGHGMNSETSKFLMSKARELETMPLYIDDSSDTRASDLLAKCRVFENKYKKLDLVVVDYLQMMPIKEKSENRNVGVGENSRMLKVLAKELKVPVLTLAQLSRDVEKRPIGKPQLSDLRESGSIEQDADMVWFIHRPIVDKLKKQSADGHEPSDDEKREAFLIVAKHRNGSTANIRLEFHGEITTFKNRPLYTLATHPDDVGFNDNYSGG